MARLYVENNLKKPSVKKIADAVYSALGQTENLKAELIAVSGERIRELNREERNVDRVTDVLSFPTLENHRGKVLRKEDYPTEIDGRYLFIGSVVICRDKIKEQAIELGHSEEEETTYLIVHGLCHLFGYDHMEDGDKKEMRTAEKKALALLGVKDE